MRKKWWIIIISLIILSVIALSAAVIISIRPETINNPGSTSGGSSISFADFSAELYCINYEYSQMEEDNEARADYISKVSPLLKKYSYSPEDAEELSIKYKDDIDFTKSVLEKVKRLCPNAAPTLEENIQINEKGYYIKVNIYEGENRAERSQQEQDNTRLSLSE